MKVGKQHRGLYDVGQRVQLAPGIAGPEERRGKITKKCPNKGGYLVKHLDGQGPLGWMEYEIEMWVPWWSNPWVWIAAFALTGMGFYICKHLM